MPDSLQDTGALDDAVVRAIVRTDPPTGYRYIKREEAVAFKDLDFFGGSFAG